MKKLPIILGVCLSLGMTASVTAGPAEDQEAFQNYFKKKFSDVTDVQEFGNGVYAVDPIGRESWEAIEEFPPYETSVDNGETMWNTPFKNGKGFKDCFADGPGVADKYPYWDKESSSVMTLPLAVNKCLTDNGEEPLKYKKGKITEILSYMTFESRGKPINVEMPDDPKALEAYQQGKDFWFAKRGQLNLSCAHCHALSSGQKVRADTLSPGFGHTTSFPVYRSSWGNMGTLHRRFAGCNKQVRAKPFKAQGDEYRNMEFFLAYMSNGLEINGPSARK